MLDLLMAGPEVLTGLVEEQMKWVSGCLAAPHRCWMPHLGILTRTWEGVDNGMILYALAVDFNAGEEKRRILRHIGRDLYDRQIIPVAAALSTEAWTSACPLPDKLPAEQPDRREVITIQAATTGNKHVFLVRMPISRDEQDNFVAGTWEPVITEGVTANLLMYLWAGFFDHVAAKFGHPNFAPPAKGGG